MAPINVTTSKQQITASVADDKIVANVTGGFGATGPSGVITVAAPITNSGTTTAANIGLAIGTGLSVSGGSLVVTPGTYATLVNGTVPAEQLPSYVDDVLEYANLASFPVTGESGKIYVALNSGKCYRWSGSAYFEISTQPGDTDAVPEGSTNLYFTNARARNAFGSGTTGQVLTWSGGQWTAGNAYTLPTASVSTLGGVKIGSGISIDGDGVISASAAYTLPTATNSVLGGVKIGSGVTITDGVISVSTNYAAATHSHAISDVTDLSTTLSGIDSALAGKLSSTDASVTNAREWTADTVSQAEAEAGTATTRRAWTALRVWQAIAAWWATVTVGTSKIANGAVTAAKIASAQDVSFKSVSTQGAGVGITPDEGVNAITVYYAGPPSFVVSDTGAVTAGAWLGTRIGIAYGGTNATTAAGARTNLGVAYGSTAGTVCQGNDARLSDARTPTAHNQAWSTITSTPTTLSGYGITDAAAQQHAHSATADLTFAGATAGQVLTVNSGATALVWATPTTYTLPQATGSTLGGITVSTGLSVASGALSVSYGTTSGTACQGNDSRLSDSRAPSGSAGGDLTGTYPNPTIANGAVTLIKTTGIQKTITSGTAAPTGGSDGDIYLRYV